MDNSVGEWREYSRLVISELHKLNKAAESHNLALIEIQKTLLTQTNKTTEIESDVEELKTKVKPIVHAYSVAGVFAKIGTGLIAGIASVIGILDFFKIK